MRLGIIAFLLGASTLQLFAELPDVRLAWFLILVIPALLLFPWLRIPSCFALGFLWALLWGSALLSGRLPVALEGLSAEVVGTVVSLPQYRPGHTRFDFQVVSLLVNDQPWPSPGRVRLSWYGDRPELIPGEQWQLRVRLKRPRGFMNPGGFDYERWLFQQRIRASGYVRTKASNRRLSQADGEYLDRMRQTLSRRITGGLTSAPEAALVKALAIGLRDDISPAQWQVLTRTGTSHLVAISGLHIGLVAGFAFFLGRWLWSLPGYTVLYLAAPRVGAIVGLGAAVVYAALAGFSIPTQRALIMLSAVMMGVLTGWRLMPLDLLMLALLLVVLIDPLSVLAPGFWLSFCAVGAILYGMGGRVGRSGIWWRFGRVQVVVAIGLAPLLLLLFGHNPTLGPLANLVAVPWVSLVVVPLVLLGILLLVPLQSVGLALLDGAGLALAWLWIYLDWLAGFGFAQWRPAVSGFLAAGLSLFGVVLVLMPRGLPGRWLSAVFLLPLFTTQPARPAQGEYRLTLLDVGQGLATVVQTAHHVLVFDTGPSYGPHFDTGSRVVLPFLQHYGIDRIDTLVLSHGDKDHSGGLQSVLDSVSVGKILFSAFEPPLHPQAQHCADGTTWSWDGVAFKIIHPSSAYEGSANNRSCVLRISNDWKTALLTGDIERLAEQDLLSRRRKDLRAAILVVPHHGSKTSSSPDFIAAVAPDFALFSVGYRNRFGFPDPTVLQRYRQSQSETLSTAAAGAISFQIGRQLSAPTSYRKAARRYWHTRD